MLRYNNKRSLSDAMPLIVLGVGTIISGIFKITFLPSTYIVLGAFILLLGIIRLFRND